MIIAVSKLKVTTIFFPPIGRSQDLFEKDPKITENKNENRQNGITSK
jgi:hypothetical protein